MQCTVRILLRFSRSIPSSKQSTNFSSSVKSLHHHCHRLPNQWELPHHSIIDGWSFRWNQGLGGMDIVGVLWIDPSQAHLGSPCLHSCQWKHVLALEANCTWSSNSCMQGAGMAPAPHRGRANPKLASGCCWWDCKKTSQIYLRRHIYNTSIYSPTYFYI